MSQSKSSRGRVIVTFGRSYQALAAVQSLGRRGVEVVVCDEAPIMVAEFSKYTVGRFVHPPAKKNPQAFLDSVLMNVARFAPEDESTPYVLMPIYEQTRLFAEYRERFEPRIRVASPPFDAIEQVDPKHKLTATATRLGLPIPKTWQIASHEHLEAILPDVQFPVFLKLPHTSGGLGLHRAETAVELREAYLRTLKEFDVTSPDQRPIVQQAVRGADYCVTMLLQHGKVKAHLTYRNVKTYPWTGGSGAIRETVEAKPLVDMASRLLSALEWHGVAEVDFIWNGRDDGNAHLIEVNPRFWGGLFHTIESGVDYPWMLYQMITTGVIDAQPEGVVGARTQVPLFGVLAAIKDIRQDLLEEMEHHCERGVEQIKDGAVGQGLRSIAHGMHRGIGLKERLKRLQEFLNENRNARTEIFSTEDPQACLGILFGLASLIRNGELPEQFRKR
ncbi:MAG: hypothetical protein CMJ58_01465 [Planctomycetaceae bacterium]|nr:hypothetical protein [Planctomycetaceae bacterium]